VVDRSNGGWVVVVVVVVVVGPRVVGK
jgi:hypothetical protein